MASTIGLSYSDFLQMDIREYKLYLEGFLDRRELQLNDNQALIKPQASYIALAVWGSKKFNRELKPIKLRGETRAAKIAAALNNLGVKKDGLEAFMRRREKRLNGRK